MKDKPLRLKLISCEVFCREMCAAITRSPNQVDLQFLPKGLHSIPPAQMLQRIQKTLDAVDESKYDAILFGYGLCNNGLAGLKARELPLVLPRAHDCITLFLGSKERYLEYFHSHPGVYFKTTGWIERSKNSDELNQLSIHQKSGMNQTYEEMVEKYGEDNARYLFDQFSSHAPHYGQYTFIEMGVEPHSGFEEQVRADSQKRGWKYEKIKGDLSLIQRFLDGHWDPNEFLVVEPGAQIEASFDKDIVSASSSAKCGSTCKKCEKCKLEKHER